eukprot:1183875-Pleurochrysis_carterae.AAC.1
MLAEAPTAASPRSGMDARPSAHTHTRDTPTTVPHPRPCSPTHARPNDAPPTVNQSRPYSACTMLSILLNFAALGAIVAIGSKQLWNYGAALHWDPPSCAPLASLPLLFLLTLLLLIAPARPRKHIL